MTGEIKIDWPDGCTYSGHWSEGDINGEGVLKNPISRIEYKGRFKNGMKDGKGKIEQEWDNGLKVVYDGDWVRNKKHGKGSYFARGKDGKVSYTGDWVEGKKHGYAEVTYADGSKYKGYFKDDEKEGEGTYT